jgi:hypothetical protein
MQQKLEETTVLLEQQSLVATKQADQASKSLAEQLEL